jgi:recombination protein RecR
MNLVAALKELPGIGQKSAARLAFMLILEKPELSELLRKALAEAAHLKPCKRCGFVAAGDLCPICEDPSRENVLCVVEKPQDLVAIERTNRYRGRYFILGGLLSPMEGMTEEKLPFKELIQLIDQERPLEIIFAISPKLEGELTLQYIKELLGERQIPITRIASGVPVGAELEYSDEMTLSRALEGRRQVG